MDLQNKLYSIDIPSTATKVCIHEPLETPETLFIFVATWDGKVVSIKYDQEKKTLLRQREIDITRDLSKPVLAIAQNDNKVYVSAEISEEIWGIYQIDLEGDDDFDIKKQNLIGEHAKPINQLIIGEHKKLYSFGFDGLCQVWSIDEIDQSSQKSYQLGRTVTQVQKKGGYILCVLEGKSFALLDTKSTQNEPVYFSVKSEYLKGAITSLSINEVSQEENSRDDILDFALGTIDGRIIHCEYSLSERLGEKLKGQNPKAGGVVLAHQIIHKNQPIRFPVNAIAYHKSYDGLLFSGGGEGKVGFYDLPVQKVVKNIFEDLVPVSHLLTSLGGEIVIIAKGFGWHPDQSKMFSNAKLYIYVITEEDLPAD